MRCLAWVLSSLLGVALARQATDEDGIPVQVKADLSTLLHVHAIWRHGDRTPLITLPNDTANGEESWEIGLGELTADGVKQAFRLGQLLRRRYDGFLRDNFKSSEIHVRSSDFNRTLMSAVAVLQGLFPQKHNGGTFSVWRPVPVHSVAQETDMQLRQKLHCPVAERESQRIYESKAVKEVENGNKGLLQYVGKHMGSKGSYKLSDMWFVYDPLNAVFHHTDKHKFPSWVNETIWKEILQLYDLTCKYEHSTDLLKRLRGGELLKEILLRLSDLQNQNMSWKQKMYAYSAHDETIAAFFAILGVELHAFPPYSALVLLETHRFNHEFVLQLFYKNDTDSEQIYRLPIGFCNELCTVDKLKAATKKFIPGNWKTECGLSSWVEEPYKHIGLISSVLLTISILTVAACHLLKSYMETRKIYEGRILLSATSEMDFVEEGTSLATDEQILYSS